MMACKLRNALSSSGVEINKQQDLSCAPKGALDLLPNHLSSAASTSSPTFASQSMRMLGGVGYVSLSTPLPSR